MKKFRNRSTSKTNFTDKKTTTTKMRFLILASIVLAAITSTVAFSTTSTAGSIGDFLFGSASLSDTLMSVTGQVGAKKDDKNSRLRQLAPNSLISDLAVARQGHTAARLADGRVLITGGDAGGTAEIFDAATGTSTAAGSLSVARSGHTATVLADGRVLILGGTSNGAAVSSTEIYDAATGTFSAGATMNAARSGHTATVLADGRILITGGDAIGSAEIYDAATDTFTSISTLTASRSGHSAAKMNDGRVLIVGGNSADGEELTSGEIFNPADSTFSATGNEMAHHRTRAVLRVLPDGKVQIIGGNDDLSMEVYDPNIDTIGAHGHLIPTDDEHTYLLQSDILAAQTRAAMFHNGQTDAMLDRSNFTVTELGNQALVAGGRDTNGNTLSSLTVLDSSDATVTTDKLDYQPGQTAIITGTGWQADETINIFLHEDPHTTAERRVTATADANGNFTANYLVEERDLDVTFIIGAKGQTSNRTAQTTFTDASNQITQIGFNLADQPASFTVGVPNVVSSPLRVQTRNNGGTGETVTGSGNSVTIQVTSNSATGRFDTNNGGTFTATSLSLQVIQGSQNTPNFFYRDTTAGNVTLTATVTARTAAVSNLPVGSTAAINKTVNKANSTTTIILSGGTNPSTFGDSLTFQATVAHATAGGAGTPTGTVTFKDGITTLGTGTLSGGIATFNTTTLAVGTHSITAEYGGDANFNISVSGALSQTVNAACTAPTVTTHPVSQTKTVGDAVSFSVVASGTATLNYQWRKNTINISGANSDTFAIPSVLVSDAGSYDVVVTNSCGSATSNAATLTVNKATPTITWANPADITFGTPLSATQLNATASVDGAFVYTPASGTILNAGNAQNLHVDFTPTDTANYNNASMDVSINVLKAATTTVITCPANITYTGAAIEPCSATVTGAGGLNQAVAVTYTNNVNAGLATADASYAESANHFGSSDSENFTIDKAATTTTITCPTNVTYTGSAIEPCTATVTGANLNQSATVSYTNNVNAGTATASANYAESANHLGSSDSENFTIDKAATTTTITCLPNVTFTGAAIEPCSATVTGANLNESVAVTYADNVNAGTATANASYAESANHLGSSDSENFTIDKADSTTVVTCPTNVTYTGAAIEPCTVLVTGAGGLNLTPTPAYSNNVNAGVATASYTFAGDGNHNGSSDSENFTIDKAATTTVVSCPTNVTYTGAAIEPCSATVTGANLSESLTVSYTNNVNAGTASASATYAESANHLGSSDSENFTIDKAATTTTVSCPTNVTYTGSAIEPCTATVTGANLNESVAVIYSNNVNAGTASASATYTESANYLGSNDTENFTIDKAATVTTVSCPTNVTYTGAAQEPCTATVTGANLNESVAVTYSNNVNAGTAGATATYAETANYLGSSDSENFTIDKAETTTTVSCPTNVTFTGAAIEPCTATVTGASLNESITVSYTNNVNAGTASASAMYAETANYLGSSDSENFTIDKAATTTTISCPPNATYTGAAIEPCSATVTGPNLNEAVAVSYSNNVNAGTASATATYAETANYLGSSDSKNFTIDKAATTTVVSCPANATYTGAAIEPCTAMVTGANLSESLTVSYANNVNAGVASASATYAESANHLGSTDSENFTIDKAATTTVVSCPANVTYTGSAIEPCSATITGANLNESVAVTYTDNVNAGTATANATYSESANHLGSTDSENFTIDKAATTTTVSCPTNVTFTGAAIEPCTAAVTGANLNESVAVTYTNNVNAGTATANATYTESANYLGSSDSENFTIDKAASTTVVSGGGTFVFNGLPRPASVSVTGAGGLNLTPPPVYSGNCSAAPITVAQTPCTASYTFAGDANHLGSSGSTVINITNAIVISSVTVSPSAQQYSDKVSFTATLTPGFAGVVPAASTVTFFVGTQNMGTANLVAGAGGTLTATLSNVALLEGVAGQMSPGVKTVTATFGGVNPNFAVGNATTPLSITQENATANFSGATYFATANSTSKTANLTLSTTVIDDNDGCRGDIRNAKVEFRLNTPTGTLLGGTNLPVGLVNPADSTVGTATATNISYTLTNSEFDAKGATITIYTVVKNYYTTTVSDPTTITISVPGTDGVTGGGHQVLSMSNGLYAGENGKKMNFGFTMKYGNSGRNLKGQANIIVRSNGRIYQIKSNAVDSLAIIGTAYPKGATFTTKANMKDITDPLLPIDLGGNLRLQVDMTDAALGGQTDKVGITLFNADGGLFFSSYWNGTQTMQQLLGGGNISVR